MNAYSSKKHLSVCLLKKGTIIEFVALDSVTHIIAVKGMGVWIESGDSLV